MYEKFYKYGRVSIYFFHIRSFKLSFVRLSQVTWIGQVKSKYFRIRIIHYDLTELKLIDWNLIGQIFKFLNKA